MLGIYLPAARHGSIEIRQIHGLEDMQRAVKGWVEEVRLHEPEMRMLVNEEGLANNLQVNTRATALVWAHNPAYARKQYIHGNVLLVGDVKGETYEDVPPQVEKLIRSRLFAIEYVQRAKPGPRIAEGIDDLWDAYAAAIRLNTTYQGKFRVVAA